jgi:hypothetical protein
VCCAIIECFDCKSILFIVSLSDKFDPGLYKCWYCASLNVLCRADRVKSVHSTIAFFYRLVDRTAGEATEEVSASPILPVLSGDRVASDDCKLATAITTCNTCMTKFLEMAVLSGVDVSSAPQTARCRNCRATCKIKISSYAMNTRILYIAIFNGHKEWPTVEIARARVTREKVDRLSLQLGVARANRKLVLSSGPSGRLDDKCPLCLDDPAVSRSRGYIIERSTGHSFHVSCALDMLFSQAIAEDVVCPICRDPWFHGRLDVRLRSGATPDDGYGSQNSPVGSPVPDADAVASSESVGAPEAQAPPVAGGADLAVPRPTRSPASVVI